MEKFLIGIVCIFVYCSSDNCNDAKFTVESIMHEWSKIDGSTTHCGELKKNTKFSTISWKDIYSDTLLTNTKLICTNNFSRESPECPEDSLYMTAYQNGIIIEESNYYICYWITGRFPTLKNGIKPDMSIETIKTLLGTPLFEKPCKLQYECEDQSSIVFFFKKDKLYSIFHSESYPCD